MVSIAADSEAKLRDCHDGCNDTICLPICQPHRAMGPCSWDLTYLAQNGVEALPLSLHIPALIAVAEPCSLACLRLCMMNKYVAGMYDCSQCSVSAQMGEGPICQYAVACDHLPLSKSIL